MKKEKVKSYTQAEIFKLIQEGKALSPFRIKVIQKYKALIKTPRELLNNCYSSKN